MRIDKFTLAGLESILRMYLDEKEALKNIPTLAMISAPIDVLNRRAHKLVRRIRKKIPGACLISVFDTVSRVGGGAMPEQNLASRAVIIEPAGTTVSRLEKKLRQLEVPVIGRVEDDRLILDMRTVADNEVNLLSDCLIMALTSSAA